VINTKYLGLILMRVPNLWFEVCGEIRSSGKNYFAYFPYIRNLFEVIEPNLMKCNLIELTLTSFNLI
jgi:hypothetical protein